MERGKTEQTPGFVNYSLHVKLLFSSKVEKYCISTQFVYHTHAVPNCPPPSSMTGQCDHSSSQGQTTPLTQAVSAHLRLPEGQACALCPSLPTLSDLYLPLRAILGRSAGFQGRPILCTATETLYSVLSSGTQQLGPQQHTLGRGYCQECITLGVIHPS